MQPMQPLPYATPMGYGQYQQATGAWQDGVRLVTTALVTLPDRCVKCNAPAFGKPLRKKYYWHNPWLYVMILLPGLLIYAIVAMIVRKSATIDFCLCAEHRRRRSTWLAITWGICLAAVAMLIVGIGLMMKGRATESIGGIMAICFLPTIIIGAVIGLTGLQVLSPTKIDERYAWFKGAGMDFLNTLPPAR